MSNLNNNTLQLEALLTKINALSDVNGVELPELSTPANADEVFSGKQLIDGDGEVVTGTFTIDNELNTQDELIAQIQAAVDSLPEAGNGGGSGEDNSNFPYNITVNSNCETEWYYAWNNEHKALSIFILPYDSHMGTFKSISINGVDTPGSNYSYGHIGLIKVISVNDVSGDVILTISYNTSEPPLD